MNGDIKIGDLAFIVSSNGCPCPALSTVVGKIIKVRQIRFVEKSYCDACGALMKGELMANGPHEAIALWRLKKIDPPAEPETTETREEATA